MKRTWQYRKRANAVRYGSHCIAPSNHDMVSISGAAVTMRMTSTVRLTAGVPSAPSKALNDTANNVRNVSASSCPARVSSGASVNASQWANRLMGAKCWNTLSDNNRQRSHTTAQPRIAGSRHWRRPSALA